MTEDLRFCPHCGTRTADAFCPQDQVATFELKAGDPDGARLNAGDVVAGKYRVTKMLGRGGFGAVYEADHTGGLGKVALKLLILADQNPDDIKRFYREAQVTAQLKHANTVRVFDVGQLPSGSLFLAMELLHGISLEDELKQRHKSHQVLTHAEAIDMAIDVLKSLSEAHGNGLVHRDLKPANLMIIEVDGDKMVKVLDFGIAHVQDSSLTGSGHALGTPVYMSPEQCRAQPLDARSDLYALGVILYRCVSGRPPFVDTNPLSIMFAHTSQNPTDIQLITRTEISVMFGEIVHRALAKHPDDRYANAREMRQALELARAQATTIQPPDLGATANLGNRPLAPPPAPVSSGKNQAVSAASPRFVVSGDTAGLVADSAAYDNTFTSNSADLLAHSAAVSAAQAAIVAPPAAVSVSPNMPAAAPMLAVQSPITIDEKPIGATPTLQPPLPARGKGGWIAAFAAAVVGLTGLILWRTAEKPAGAAAQPPVEAAAAVAATPPPTPLPAPMAQVAPAAPSAPNPAQVPDAGVAAASAAPVPAPAAAAALAPADVGNSAPAVQATPTAPVAQRPENKGKMANSAVKAAGGAKKADGPKKAGGVASTLPKDD